MILRLQNWLFNLIRCNDVNDSSSISKESTDSPCPELFIKISNVSALETFNQSLTRNMELNDCVHGAPEHFWNTKEYRDVGCLSLMLLHKVLRDKGELRDFNSQFKRPINALRASRCALKESLKPCSSWTEIAENQMQSLFFWLVKLDWDPISWDGNVWEDLDEAGTIEPLHSDESSLPVEEAPRPTSLEVASSRPVV